MKNSKRPPSILFWLALYILYSTLATAQIQSAAPAQSTAQTYQLTLAETIQFAKTQNKHIQASTIEQSAVTEDRKDTYKAALPTINVNASYQRYSDLTLFSNGLSHATTIPNPPTSNAAALGIDVLFNIYSGGRQRASQNEQTSRLKLAQLNTLDKSGNIALQTAIQYLDLVRLNEGQKFILDQLKRAQTRLNNINTLYKNQKVTKSDVLRAAVNLSNVELQLQQNTNDITISNEKLDILMNIPDSVRITPLDSATMPKPQIDSLTPLVEAAGITSYDIQKAAENINLQQSKIKEVKSYNKPTLSFYAAYGINYPNYLVFPPVNQAYALGFVGLKAQYNISSLYHNKSKLTAAKLRLKELEVEQEADRDNVKEEVRSLYIKYAEALSRISINQHSVEQAEVNYRIVNTKYLNQLSLLTDLLDADNLYHESRFSLIRAQTDALAIYYHILYTSGNL